MYDVVKFVIEYLTAAVEPSRDRDILVQNFILAYIQQYGNAACTHSVSNSNVGSCQSNTKSNKSAKLRKRKRSERRSVRFQSVGGGVSSHNDSGYHSRILPTAGGVKAPVPEVGKPSGKPINEKPLPDYKLKPRDSSPYSIVNRKGKTVKYLPPSAPDTVLPYEKEVRSIRYDPPQIEYAPNSNEGRIVSYQPTQYPRAHGIIDSVFRTSDNAPTMRRVKNKVLELSAKKVWDALTGYYQSFGGAYGPARLPYQDNKVQVIDLGPYKKRKSEADSPFLIGNGEPYQERPEAVDNDANYKYWPVRDVDIDDNHKYWPVNDVDNDDNYKYWTNSVNRDEL
jgi:hypothetical protein